MNLNPPRLLTEEEFMQVSGLPVGFYPTYLEAVAKEMGRLTAKTFVHADFPV